MKWWTEIILQEWLLMLLGKGCCVKRLVQKKNTPQHDLVCALRPKLPAVVTRQHANLRSV